MNHAQTAAPTAADPLAGLRDIHLPPAPSWWPPAPGWWLAVLLLAAGLAWLFLARRRQLKREKPVRLALSELARIKIPPAGAEAAEIRRFIEALSTLLRRFCLVRFPEKRVAEIYGDAWVAFLAGQAPAPEREFFRRELAPLARLYAPDRELALKATQTSRLKTAVQRWLEGQKRRAAAGGKREAKRR